MRLLSILENATAQASREQLLQHPTKATTFKVSTEVHTELLPPNRSEKAEQVGATRRAQQPRKLQELSADPLWVIERCRSRGSSSAAQVVAARDQSCSEPIELHQMESR
jgi:hypothetical protein